MEEIRILFTGIGRQVELVQAFRCAACVLDRKLKIYGADMTETAPALTFCDSVERVCAMRDPGYIPQLLGICRNSRIDVVIPTIDTDLQFLANHKSAFEDVGSQVLVSTPEMVRICRDKNRTSQFFLDCGLHTPIPVNGCAEYDGPYPAFIKPKDGSSSIDAHKVNNAEELAFLASRINDYIIQPFIDGTEYTVDIFCDFSGNVVSIVPRERMAVRAGEVLKTRISMDEIIIREIENLVDRFKPCGPLTVQLIRDGKSGIDYYIEINPRFGGGAPLSMKAGAKSAEAVLRLLSGETVARISPSFVADTAVYSRFDQSVSVYAGGFSELRGVIFDLDDTLYSEKQYVLSGFKAVAEYLGNPEYVKKLWSHFEAGKQAFNTLLEEIDRRDEIEKCLKVYREHSPRISLYEGIPELLRAIKKANIKIGIITDGYVVGQNAKIKSLGLSSYTDDVIITDELGGVNFRKPNDISFRIMQTKWQIPFEEMIYIADNPEKDFQAPRQLGMRTIFFNNVDGLYHNRYRGSLSCDGVVNDVSEMSRRLQTMIKR